MPDLPPTLTTGNGAHAQAPSNQVVDLSMITCKDFLERNKKENVIGVVVVWLLGYYTREDDQLVIDFEKIQSKVEELKAYCIANPTHGLITAADEIL